MTAAGGGAGDDFFLVLDRESRVESWAPEPPIDAPLLVETWFPPVDRPLFLAGTERARRGEAVRDLRCRESARGPIWQEYGFTPLSGGRLLCWRRDVTAERAALEERERVHDKAVEYARERNEFFAMMSHEIRTPLSGVTVISELLLGTPLSAEQRDLVEKIGAGGRNLLRVVSDLLDFARLESGRIDLVETPFSMEACLEEVVDLLAPQLGAKPVELVLLSDARLPRLLSGDVVRLRQVLLNLGGNAVKFTERGEIVMAAEVKRERPGEVELRLSVKDSGIGIPIDAWGRLFQAFSQVHDAARHRFGGTGLGLALCKRLVELMKGRIWVESAVGKGTTFFVSLWLPVVEAAVAPLPLLRGRRILVADPSPARRQRACLEIRRYGGEALEAGTPEEVAGQLERVPPDTLAIDLGMAGIDETLLKSWAREGLDLVRIAPLLAAGRGEAELRKPYSWGRYADVLAKRPRAQKAGSLDTGLGARHPLRILLAEDDLDNRRVLVLLLKRLGYACTAVEDGLAAVEAVAAGTFDVVFMDMQMPRLGGLDATRRIKAAPGVLPKIVALTANAGAGEREKCLEAGMDDYLSKPVDPAGLQALLARLAEEKERG
ncbi:MAG: response regulator [Spirochaetes bacterium]|nr:response regulator [Spirochaetota bacterium]